MTDPTPSVSLCIGIDVSSEKLDLARSDSPEVLHFSNDEKGIAQIITLLVPLKPSVIVVEATGGYERRLIDAMLDAALPVARVNPGSIRYLAKGLEIIAKTDDIDAGVLVRFAQLGRPRLLQKRRKNQAELEALITCRRQLLDVRTQESNRRGLTFSKAAIRSIDAVIATLDRQIASLDKQIRKLIDSDDEFRDLDRQLKSVPGIGPVASATLISELDELGRLDRRQIGALVGVVPYNHDSGKHKGKRSIFGGRISVRNVLYMAGLAAARCNPVIRRFAQRLKEQGKCAKVIIVACVRKLLTLINAMLRDGLDWNELGVVKNP